jgi:uncharacterized protein
MTRLKVVFANGQESAIDATEGTSIMEALRPLAVGVEGSCGGNMLCATCHIRVDEEWLARLPPQSEQELAALDNAFDVGDNSRLGCQIRMSPTLDGLKIALPSAAASAPVLTAGHESDGSASDTSAQQKPQVDATPIKPGPMSERTRLKRYHWLGQYDRDSINAVIDAGVVCQVGYVIEGLPYVTPTNHWRIDDYVYWHGSSASRMLKTQQKGIPVCFTVTHLDGIVFSRAAFNHNVKFRSVVAFGECELCDEQTKRSALQTFVDRLALGLWDYARPPSAKEWKATKVIRMPLDEVSAKIADGLPDEEPEDLLSNRWAGSVDLRIAQSPPEPDPKLKPGIEMPDFVKAFRYGPR